ncbi:MAG: 1,4-alpha-glucan branching protein GlgB [Burkholderiales bacterium]|nr:1,4-alpha-glucan branching protein GlgB [Burkholderiales bacterium]
MLDAATIDALVDARAGDPFAALGMHAVAGCLEVRAFLPTARSARVLDADLRPVACLERRHAAGVFAGVVARHAQPFAYRLEVDWGAQVEVIDDPYRFGPLLGELDAWLIAEGRHERLYDVLGAHPRVHDGAAGTGFALWAPNARRVAVVGDFNCWDARRHPMRLRRECGVWEIFLPGVAAGARYKFAVTGPAGEALPLKADPVAHAAELRPATASVVSARHTAPSAAPPAAACDRPVSIYEVHAGSWRRGPGNRHLDWNEIADRLLPHVRALGFTHIELLPVMEHPFDGSWGYQPTGLYAPTARHGPPAAFAAFVERFHAAGIGVLLDWVPGHFPGDAHALARLDGTHLYEHADPRQGLHPDWDTLIYNYGRTEVCNFLAANALYWLERFGLAGLRVDAVASMLYLDYSRAPGEWIPNVHGGRENLEAVRFLRDTNRLVSRLHPGAVTIAEESTAWPGVSEPAAQGGLGFSYKWNMGWMHDVLDYMRRDPVHRQHHHHQLTFGLMYAFSEKFVLPLSHDEVVHGKGSLLAKMPGDRWQKFANLRLLLAFMWAHPGKKLLFMGGEFGQATEWDHDGELDWGALADRHHDGVMRLTADLNRAYRDTPALHQRDCDAGGFEWIDFADREQSIIAFLRRGRDDDALALAVCNFTPVPRHGYRLGVPRAGRWRELVNTDSAWYGGSDLGNGGAVESVAAPSHDRAFSVSLTLPPLACVILAWTG